MSGHDTPSAATTYGRIIVVGGGCYGSYYVRQLRRAQAAGALTYREIVVVDRDPACTVAEMPGDDCRLVVSEWTPFFDDYLAQASPADRDAIVPSPLMPHLMYEWLLRRARARWPERLVESRPLGGAPDVPWSREVPDGTLYASFATWMCPINCVEPRRCPHTRSERTWTMPVAAERFVTGQRTEGRAVWGPVIFHCTHRAYGVGMFDTADVLAGDATVADAGAHGPTEVLVGTVSHCHGAFNLLHVR